LMLRSEDFLNYIKESKSKNTYKEYIYKAARNIKEAQKLIKSGFKYVTKINSVSLFRKLKSTYLGSVTTETGVVG